MTTEDLVLPELCPKPRTAPVPKRYEETRPVIVQEFSHRRILDLGTELHKQFKQELQKEKIKAIQVTETDVWAQANIVKQEALDTQKAKLQADHEKVIKRINKKHDQMLKEELTRLSNQLDRLRLDDIAQTKRDGERKLEEAVQQTEQLWQKKLLQAVEDARCEEQQKAASKAAEVARQHQNHLVKVEKQMTLVKERALSEQKVKLEAEKVIAVETARQEVQASANSTASHAKELFEKQVAILHGKIGELRRDVSSQKRLTNSVIQHRVKIQLELVETREEFQTFIDVVRPFNESESKYILPPIKSFTDADMADGLL